MKVGKPSDIKSDSWIVKRINKPKPNHNHGSAFESEKGSF
jgi:hypothetical protein